MLKIRLALIALITVYFVLYGCGGGGGSINLDAQARTDLVGTWRLVQAGQPGGPTITCPGVFQVGGGTPVACTANYTITLNNDGTFRTSDGSTGVWSVSNGNFSAVSGSNTISGNLVFNNENQVTVRDSSGRYMIAARVI